MVCGKEAQYSEIIAISANQIRATEIPWRYKNVVLYSPDPFSSWNVDGGLGTRLCPQYLHAWALAMAVNVSSKTKIISMRQQ